MDAWNISTKIEKFLVEEPEISPDTKCSFCGKRRDQVNRFIAGPGNVFICNECTDLYRGHIEKMASAPTSIEKLYRLADLVELVPLQAIVIVIIAGLSLCKRRSLVDYFVVSYNEQTFYGHAQ